MSLERIQISLGLKAEERERPTRLQQLEESVSCSEMSHEDRLFGFALCFGAGVLLSLSSMFSFARLLRGHPRDFAVKYTVGNILAICSTAFLISPRRQFRQMTEESRWVAAAVWIGAMVATLLSAFVTKIAAVTLLCIVVQFSAGIWCVRLAHWRRHCGRAVGPKLFLCAICALTPPIVVSCRAAASRLQVYSELHTIRPARAPEVLPLSDPASRPRGQVTTLFGR